MIASMTGFGRAETTVDGQTATVEVRSVNSRFCEVSIRSPSILTSHETDIQRLVKQVIPRGRISVQIQLETAAAEGLPVSADTVAAAEARRILEDVCAAANLPATSISLQDILRFSEVLATRDPDAPQDEEAWEATRKALEEALDALRVMRGQEGEALHEELSARITGLSDRLSRIEVLAPQRVVSSHERLRQRLAEMLADDRVDQGRLEVEMALLADKLDVREECVRLHSHVHLFNEALASSEPVGRKLNFLTQEMNREVNTIGSKSNDAEMAHLVVGMKEELEKIREQVENVE